MNHITSEKSLSLIQCALRVCAIALAMVVSNRLCCQDVQIHTEDFETGGVSVSINNGGPGTNSGNNLWIVNNQYSGAPTYPNTTTQDNTVSGTIGFAPTSNYLHIHNQPSGITNSNYSPSSASDQFAYLQYGMCTYGMTDVHFSFFWLCEGTANAYGTVYYSVDGGPWIATGQPQYNNSSNWQYEDITDAAFSDVGSLRFGFRWQNNSANTPNNLSFSIDDINIVASYSSQDPVTINVTAVIPNPVCEGSFVTIEYALSDTLCDGNYSIELSNSQGNFPSPFTTWVMPINYPNTSGAVSILLPANAAAGNCYKIRISRLSPDPQITGISSACFQIIDCPNVINTQQPVVATDTNAVCISSAIDVPFTSTGIFNANNNYICQLSEPDGTFSSSPPVVGTFPNSATYDPNLGQMPGNVSGLVPDTEPGCNYYLRVVSTSPAAIGSPWGPFCIQECDITTNNTQDLSFCVSSCDIDPDGENETLSIDINSYDNVADYGAGNMFTTQLLSSQNFGQIGANGILGSVSATNNSQLNVHVPCLDSLGDYGIPLGMNYMRIVANNSTVPDNALGTLIPVTIGALHTEPQTISSYEYPSGLPKDTFCIGETAMLLFSPYNFFDNSTFMWKCNGINGGQPFVSPSGANSNSLYVNLGATGTLTFSIQETSYGCVSPWTPIKEVVVLGDPLVNITGPANVCMGDTSLFQVNFTPNTYYSWSTTANMNVISYQDTSNNVMNIAFSATGNYTLNINVLNQCGSDDDSQIVHVLPFPDIVAGQDTILCDGGSTQVSTTTCAGCSYSWSDGTSTIGSTSTLTVSPLVSTFYVITVTATGGCQSHDTVDVLIDEPDPPIIYYDSLCPGGDYQVTLNTDSIGTYDWSTGSQVSTTIVNDTGTYNLSILIDGHLCEFLEQYEVLPMEPEPPVVFYDSICPGGGNIIALSSDATGSYLWSTGSTSSFTTVNNPGVYELEVNIPGSVCPYLEEYQVWALEPDPPVLRYDSLCPYGGHIELSADTTEGEYAWDTGSTNSYIEVSDTGTYVLHVFLPGERCPITLQYEITPDTCYIDTTQYHFEELYFYIPNAFTPNSNEVNEVFGPVFSNTALLAEYKFIVFDRWGEPVFVSEDPEQPWTGNFMGGDYFVEDGAYAWLLEFRNVHEVNKRGIKGHVVMIR